MLVAVYGSPRANGNTDILMNAFLSGASKYKKIISYKLRDMVLKPCIGCDFCFNSGICIYKDNIWDIYENLDKAEGLILSSPIYFASVTAQLKAFIDRGQAFWNKNRFLSEDSSTGNNRLSDENNQNIRKGFYISVGAMNTDKYFLNSRLVVRSFFISMNIKPSGELFFPGIDAKGEIKNYPEAIDTAYKAGIKFVKNEN